MLDIDALFVKEFTERFGGRYVCAVSVGWPVYLYRGKDYLLDETIADPETVIKTSLGQSKNLIIKTFPTVNLYPDPNVEY